MRKEGEDRYMFSYFAVFMVDLQALVGLVRILQVPGMVFSFYFSLSPLYFPSLVNDKQILLQVTLILKDWKKGGKEWVDLKKMWVQILFVFPYIHHSTFAFSVSLQHCSTLWHQKWEKDECIKSSGCILSSLLP